MKLHIVAVVGFLSLSVFLPAQTGGNSASAIVPPVIQFSNVAMDEAGNPLTGTVAMTFALYNSAQGGQPLWSETQTVALDNLGHYSAYLGITKPNGVPMSLFTTAQAHWLGVQPQGQPELPRVFLATVPYAMKAGDAATVGGLPPSAFLLAPSSMNPESSSSYGPSSSSTSPAVANAGTPPVGGTGTQNYIPIWADGSGDLGNSVLYQSGTGSTAKVGINEKNPLLTLDVNGSELVRGLFEMATVNYATATKGYNSQPLNFESSAFNSGTSKYTLNHFQWQSEPTGNNTTSPGASLNLLYGTDPATPTETGLLLNSKGIFTFAPTQTFPGTGTVTSVGLSAPSTDFTVTGSPITKSGTLALAWKVAPTNSDTANAIVKRDANGAFSAGQITSQSTLSTAAVLGTNYSGSALGPGVEGDSEEGFGVSGKSTDGFGVYGNGYYGVGVYGVTFSGQGVWGQSAGATGAGVYAVNTAEGGTGVYATSPTGYGVFSGGDPAGYFQGTDETGQGFGPGDGLDSNGGDSQNYYGGPGGVFGGGDGNSADGGGDGIVAVTGFPEYSDIYAGYFLGNVEVTGNLSKGGGSFKIDHPLDPANKYLYHSFVESPDMMNVYNGNIVLDGNGEATIQLPDWFQTLNRDFRYQLTSIGAFSPVYVAQKVQNNAFKIAGGKAGMEVSWQVTGIRQDPWADAHRIPVEENKPARERGFYLHPELYGAPQEKGIEWARQPGIMKRHKAARAKAEALSAMKAGLRSKP
jgi:hypothetical protein